MTASIREHLLGFLTVLHVAGASSGAPPSLQQPAAIDAEVTRIDSWIGEARYLDAFDALSLLEGAPELSLRQRATLLERLAWVELQLGRSEDALVTSARAEALLGSGDEALLARLSIVRGGVWRHRGFAYRAVEHFTRALRHAEAAARPDLRRQTLILLSSAHQDLGDWSRVLDYAERAFEADPSPSDSARFQYLVQRGIAYYEFHDRDRALESFQRALAIARRSGNARAESAALGELGLVAWEFDRDRDRAIALYEEAIEAGRSISVPALQVTWLNNLGNVYRDVGELQEALARYERAYSFREDTGAFRNHSTILKNMGQVLSRLKRPAEAERHLLLALETAEAQKNPKVRWQARMELAELHRDGSPDEAARYFEETLDVIEAHHGSALLESFRVGMLGRALEQYDPYDRYVSFLLERGEGEKAFVVAERARARIFLETLTVARPALAGTVPQEYLDAESRVLQRLSDQQARLREADLSRGERREILSAIDAAEEELTALRLRLAVEQPAVADVRFPRLWSPDELQARILAPGEVIVLFFLGTTASASWILDRDAVELVRLPPRPEIERAVRELLPTLESPQAEVDEDARSWLSTTLLGPLSGRLEPGQHLVIVPHAILHYLPFEVLDDARGRYLVERHSVSYAPSISSLAHLRLAASSVGPGPPRLLAVGNPQSFADPAATQRQGPLEWIGRLKPLPHTRTEIRAIAEAFAPRSELLDEVAATEENLRRALAQPVDILHFATHALVDEERPERSGLALSRGSEGTDGILQPREIYELDLPAALVTLSACRTALGREVTGEGLIGLSRAFFYAGVRSVAASLWNVDDRSTAELMETFYGHLQSGESVADALAKAKRSFLDAASPWRHPYYWAPFVVTGHAAAAVAPPRPLLERHVALVGAIVLLAFAISLAAWARRRHSRSVVS